MTKKKIESIDSFTLNNNLVKDALSLFSDLKQANKKPILLVKFDATHSGRLTNRRVYPGRHMRNAVDSFLSPYPKPILKHHNDEGDPLGRVTSAQYIQVKQGDEFLNDYKSPKEDIGSGFIRLEGNITDIDAIEKWLDGRYNTVSTRQSFDSMLCSVCGADFADSTFYEQSCEHIPGKTYTVDKNTFLCYGITGPLKYREVSVVNIPGDDEAKTTGFELIHKDSEEPFVIHCKENDALTLFDVSLSNGTELVSLLETENHTSISKEDRKKLTGKIIVSVSPMFNMKENKSMENKEQPQDKKEDLENKTVDTTTEENTVDEKTSEVNSKSDDQNNSEQDAKEGVVAPEQEDSEENDQKDVKVATPEVDKELSTKVARLEKDLKDKDEEIVRVRKSLTEKDSELKNALATLLIQTRIFLRKSDVASIKTTDELNSLVVKYSERTIESLRDSISDLAPELLNMKGVTSLSARDILSKPKISNPVKNGPAPVKDKKTPIKVKTKQELKQEAVERAKSFINN